MNLESLTVETLGSVPESLGRRLHKNHMELLGIGETMRLAHAYNHLKFGRQDEWRRQLYQDEFKQLLEENGSFNRPPVEMKDGWGHASKGLSD